ncbi:MAG: hypothetical protein VXY73_14405 [Pseudomonadota bacterium]|jgi:hypothetical protein|nr:hypothetical protein [Pseudomonadota bacterium]
MSKHVPVVEIHFKSLLEHAERMKVMFGGFQWYGPPITPGLPQSNLLNGQMFYSAPDFFDMLREMQIYCIRHPNDHGLDHALIYVFDGRDERPKFHHYLWKPLMGATMERVDYWKAVPDDFYARHAFDALMAQRKPVKVSTVVNAALKRVRGDMGADGTDDAHRAALRSAVAAFINTNPLVHSQRVDSPKNPHGGYTMVEHLGIYDREPKWLK